MPMPSMPAMTYSTSGEDRAGVAEEKAATAPAWKTIIAVAVIQLRPFWCLRP